MKFIIDIPDDESSLMSRELLINAVRTGTRLPEDIGDFSDGYHTFNQLYHQRAVLFATIVNLNKDISWKSWKHEDGKYCFDRNGEWFIVGVDTPEGSYTYHYSKEYWDMFKCEELECGKHWDGHTEEDVTRLLSLNTDNLVDGKEAINMFKLLIEFVKSDVEPDQLNISGRDAINRCIGVVEYLLDKNKDCSDE